MASHTSSPVHPRLAQFQGYFEQDPENIDLLSELVNLALETGRQDIAVAALDRLSPEAAGLAPVVHLRSLTLLASGRYVEAEELLMSVRASRSLPAGSHFNLAYALFRQEWYQDAAKEFRSLLAMDGAPPATLAWLIRTIRQVDGLQPALAVWEGAAPAARSPEACGVASLLYFDANQLPQARDLARQALSQGGRPSEALATEAGVAIIEDRVDDAIALMQEALSHNARDGRLWSTLAAAFMRRKDLQSAHEAYEKAVSFTADHIGTWHGFAWCQIMAGDLEGAAGSFQRAMDLDRNFGETHGGVAVVAALQGREPEARAAIERALRLDSAGLSARFAEAVLSGEAKDRQALLRLANRLLGSRPAPLGGSLAQFIAPSSDDSP